MSDLEGKALLVTGAASGIGRAVALLAARRGAAVAAADINADGVQRTAGEIEAAGGRSVALTVDLTDEAAVEAMVAATLDRFGALDAAVNNAGIRGRLLPLHETPKEDWDRVVAADLTAAFLCMKHEIGHMRTVRRGAIVTVASGAGRVAAPGLSPYAASKHAVLGLVKSAAKELAGEGIRVNAVCPGIIDTPMVQSSIQQTAGREEALKALQPGGRFGRPEEVAELVLWLCSDASSFVSGSAVTVDGAAICY